MSLKNKLVLLTGAARGLGRSMSHAYARRGATLILVDINAAGLSSTAAALTAAGHAVHAHTCDVSSAAAVSTLAATVIRDVGVPHIVHNNTMATASGGILDADVEGDIRRQLDVNVLGYLRVAQAFLPAMVAAARGRLVFTVSPNALMPAAPPVAHGLLGTARARLLRCRSRSVRR